MHSWFRNLPIASLLVAIIGNSTRAADCNGNGVDDAQDLAPAAVRFEAVETSAFDLFLTGLAAQDLDGDGRPDLAVAQSSHPVAPPAGGVFLVSQSPDGSFAPPAAVQSGLPVQAVAAGDLEGDGRPDLVFLEGGDRPSLVVLASDGKGNFHPSAGAPDLNGPFFSIDLADQDGDHYPEIILEGHTTFHAKGDGTFEPPVLSLERWLAGRSALFRDLDGDGDLDLALAGHPAWPTYAGITIFRNDGKGTFTALHSYSFSSSTGGLDGGDLDEDGDVDLATLAGGPGSVAVLRNDGKAAFLKTGEFFTIEPARTIALADLDGDRRLDLTLTFREENTLALWPGTGNGTFRNPFDFPVSAFVQPAGQFAKQGLTVQRFSDFDGDGRIDVAVLNPDTRKAAVLLNRSAPPPVSGDCDRDGIPDECGPAVQDCDADGIPDRCETAPVLAFAGPLMVSNPTWPADLDGDGLLDAVSLFGDAVSVAPGRGGLFFGAPRLFAVPPGPSDLATADLDGDAKIDLAVTIYGNDPAVRVAVLSNLGEGTFDDWRGRPAVGEPSFLRAGDLDGDGAPDLAILGRQACLLWNDGQGGFGEPDLLPVLYRFLSMADLDGDGRRDLVLSRGNALSFLRNQGGRAFAAPRDTVADDPGAFAVADLDGDSSLDAAVASRSTASITVMLNDGQAKLIPSGTLSSGPGAGTSATVEAGDLDGDGSPDLAAWGPLPGKVAVYLNPGEGRFGSAASYFCRGGLPGRTFLVDVDGDGDLDLWSPPSILLNGGDGSFPTPEMAIPGKRFSDLAADDLDGDGKVDLAAVNYQKVSIIGNTGGGKFRELRAVKTGGDRIRSADLDGNGKVDLLAMSERPGEVRVLLNDGSGAFQAVPAVAVPGRPTSAAFLDADGDGDLDLATSSEDPYVLRLLVNGGRGDFTAQEVPVFGNSSGIAAGDVDGDRIADLLQLNAAGVSILRNSGAAVFGNAGTLVVSGIPRSAVLEDLDGDSRQDLAVRCTPFASPTGAVSIITRAGAGWYSAAASYRLNIGPLLASDLDRDGSPDLVGSIQGGVAILLNNGRALFDRSVGIPSGDSDGSPAAADVDGDGWPDLVQAMSNPEGILVVRNLTSGNRPGDCNGNGTPDSCEIAGGAARDCNRNGRPDSCDLADGFSEDRNGNGLLDECEAALFRRGDVNGEGDLDLTDALVILGHLFQGWGKLDCLEAADVNNDSAIDLSDAVFTLSYLFLGGSPPPSPGPPPLPCGKDSGEGTDLGCESYGACRPSA